MAEEHFMKPLDVAGWRACYFDARGEPTEEEAEALRWEQWFIGGNLYVYTRRPNLQAPWESHGIVEDHDAQNNVVKTLNELQRFIEPEDEVHPLLVAMANRV